MRIVCFGPRFRTWAILLCVVMVWGGSAVWAGTAGAAVIVLDPGHGGMDPGAVDEANGILEKTLNLQVAQRTRARLEVAGHTVIMTRDGDDVLCHTSGDRPVKRWIGLEERVVTANRYAADIFISIHANSFYDPSCAGAEVFYHPASRRGRLLADSFHAALQALHPPVECSVRPSDYYVLRGTRMPALLVETGYITNADEAKLLLDPLYQERLAAAFTAAIDDYLS